MGQYNHKLSKNRIVPAERVEKCQRNLNTYGCSFKHVKSMPTATTSPKVTSQTSLNSLKCTEVDTEALFIPKSTAWNTDKAL